MTELVLDASVVLKWIAPAKLERHAKQARSLRNGLIAGELLVVVPTLLELELLNVAGRKWGWREPELLDLVDLIDALGFISEEADTAVIASWVARGLTAYDAAYVALAEERRIMLVTDDETTVQAAPDLAVPLARV